MQTLYSWCGMVHALNSGMRATDTSRELFGAPYAGLCHDFPSHLDHLFATTSGSLGDARHIAQHHTLLGYFLPLVKASLAEEIVLKVCGGSIPQLKMQLGITASRLGGHHPLKGCRLCFAASGRDTGVVYWRVDQQFPSSFVCPVHGIPLATAWDPVTPVHRRQWLLPQSGLARTWVEQPLATDGQLRVLTRLQSDSLDFSKLPPGSLDSAQLAATYRSVLREAGLATPKGNLRLRQLSRRVRSHYTGLEHLPGMHVLASMHDEWPGLAAALSRRVPRPGHPFKHLLLISCLFDSWKAFVMTYDSTCVFPHEKSQPARPNLVSVQRQEFQRLVADQKLSIRAASIKLNISTTSGVQWAKRLGLVFRSRPKALTARVEAAIERRLRRGESVDEIAKVSAMSVTTVRRVLGSSPDTCRSRKACLDGKKRGAARKSFSRFCARNAGIPLSALRSTEGNPYAWLYRNDREWLQSQLKKFGRYH
jgi:hypothetical protein